LIGCSFTPGKLTPVIDAPLADGDNVDATIDSVIDAPPDTTTGATCTPSTCTALGGTCSNDGTCEIVAAPNQAITCPATSTCSVDCLVDNRTCGEGMTCGTSSDCTFHCDADHTCDNSSTLVCGAGSTCEVFCKG